MKSISELQIELLEIAKIIVNGTRPNGMFLMPESSTDTGAAHAEIVNGQYHYVTTERGSEYIRKTAANADELLYWFTSDSVFELASNWELEHRIYSEDSRRQIFSKEIELLEKVNSKWAETKRLEIENILKVAPFSDIEVAAAKTSHSTHKITEKVSKIFKLFLR